MILKLKFMEPEVELGISYWYYYFINISDVFRCRGIIGLHSQIHYVYVIKTLTQNIYTNSNFIVTMVTSHRQKTYMISQDRFCELTEDDLMTCLRINLMTMFVNLGPGRNVLLMDVIIKFSFNDVFVPPATIVPVVCVCVTASIW